MLKTSNIKKHKFSLIQEFLDLNFLSEEIVLAGGSLRSLINSDEIISDYDLFFLGENFVNNKEILEKKILELGGVKSFQCELDELRTFSLNGSKIQFITTPACSDVFRLLDSFDINACRFAFDGVNFYFFKQSIKDILKKHITIHKVTYPVATLKRIAKYNKKGYKITLAAKEFVLQVANNGLDMDLEKVYVD
jgi:hypothetical protein